MKTSILLLLVSAVSFIAESQNYFKEGTKWVYDSWETIDPTGFPCHTVVTYWLEHTENEGVLALLADDDTYPFIDRFQAFIKTEGEKVYFKVDKDPNSNDYLLYDFGLSPGEGDYFYYPSYPISSEDPSCNYMKCTAIQSDTNASEWKKMRMEVYNDDSCSHKTDEGCWIKGLGSERGLLSNYGFNLDGAGLRLREVFENENLIYSVNPSGVATLENKPDCPFSLNGLTLDFSYNTNEIFSICSFMGYPLLSGASSSSILLPGSGIYIVRIGDKSWKIMIP